MLKRWFLDHPKSVRESYFEHRRMAWGYSLSLLKAALACFVHGLVPGMFQSTASRAVAQLHGEMTANRRRAIARAPDTACGLMGDAI